MHRVLPDKSFKPLFVVNKNNGTTDEIVFTIFDSYEKKNLLYSIDVNSSLNIKTMEEMRKFISSCFYNTVSVKKFSNINTLVNSLTGKLFKSTTSISNINQEIILTDMYSYLIASKRYLIGNYNFNVLDNKVEFTYNYGSVLVPEIDTQVIEFSNNLILDLEINNNRVLVFKVNPDITIRLFD